MYILKIRGLNII